jgi:hypothetical protein
MIRIKSDELYSLEQFREHKQIIKLPGVRCYDMTERGRAGHGRSVLVWYKQGIADNSFMVEYDAEGTTRLFFEHASLDNVTTLKELLLLPAFHSNFKVFDLQEREENIPEDTFVDE